MHKTEKHKTSTQNRENLIVELIKSSETIEDESWNRKMIIVIVYWQNSAIWWAEKRLVQSHTYQRIFQSDKRHKFQPVWVQSLLVYSIVIGTVPHSTSRGCACLLRSPFSEKNSRPGFQISIKIPEQASQKPVIFQNSSNLSYRLPC